MINKQLLAKLVQDKYFLSLVIVLNVVGSVFGYLIYYQEQLLETPLYLWIFVPNSPLATSLMAISVAFYMCGIQNKLIDALAFATNIKYGLWTCFVQLYYFEHFLGAIDLLQFFIFFSHIFMALQVLLIAQYSEFEITSFLFLGFWLPLNDFMNYGKDTLTYIPGGSEFMSPEMIVAVVLTVFSITMYFLVLEKYKIVFSVT